jgi:hypothetical protein
MTIKQCAKQDLKGTFNAKIATNASTASTFKILFDKALEPIR